MLENELEEFGDADHIDYSGKPGKSIGIKNVICFCVSYKSGRVYICFLCHCFEPVTSHTGDCVAVVLNLFSITTPLK